MLSNGVCSLFQQTHSFVPFSIATRTTCTSPPLFPLPFSPPAHSAASLFDTAAISSAAGLTPQNHYGAPTPPWKPSHHPGWYYGHGTPPKGINCVLQGVLCDLLAIFHWGFYCPGPKHPQPPPPPPPPNHPPPPPPTAPYGYERKFYDLKCASQDDSGAYLTYGLVDTTCADMCDTVYGCNFFNSVSVPESADNCAGQSQPTGGLDYITASAGYCKKY
ncbi:hypothetical protein C8J57DRAFT_1507334 [Mycena rebaudengoi]|nr:hypothetical protein C8J57DRAFT_1507334 [Mycena rebaudengoi]